MLEKTEGTITNENTKILAILNTRNRKKTSKTGKTIQPEN
jgi:hypothetical protein